MAVKQKNPIAAKLRDVALELVRLADALAAEEQSVVKIGKVTYDPARGIIATRTKKILLRKTMAMVLDVLVAQRGCLATKDEILTHLYGENAQHIISRTTDTMICSLRKIVGPDSIVTVTGRGWMLK